MIAESFREQGAEEVAKKYAVGSARVQLQSKDPRGWQEFARILGEDDSIGAALTTRGVQSRRPSLYAMADELAQMTTPFPITGDEDEGCLEPDLMLKRTIPLVGSADAAPHGTHVQITRIPRPSPGPSPTSSLPSTRAGGRCAIPVAVHEHDRHGPVGDVSRRWRKGHLILTARR